MNQKQNKRNNKKKIQDFENTFKFYSYGTKGLVNNK